MRLLIEVAQDYLDVVTVIATIMALVGLPWRKRSRRRTARDS
jgi:hypothetical protein